MKSKSYRDLEIYKLSYELAMKIHRISLKLPKYELYEEGSQIRRSSKGVPSTIVEGYGRRRFIWNLSMTQGILMMMSIWS